MDKIRKIIAWIWLNKERMVLIVVVGFLCERVWQVVHPKQPVPGKHRDVPSPGPIPPEIAPPVAPGRPPMELSGDYSSLYRSNPFWLHSRPEQQPTDSSEVTALNLGVELLQIRVAAGRERVQLKTGARVRKWYTEGDAFEKFTLIEIDPDTNSVVVYSEQYGRDFTLTKR